MAQHPAAQETAVVLQEAQNDKHLVAYVVVLFQAQPTANVFRQFMNDKLPSYMVGAWGFCRRRSATLHPHQ